MLAAGIDRDPATVADRVSVSPIGTSDVVEIAVRDADARVAVEIAQGLTGQVITIMRRSGLATVPLPYVIEGASLSTTTVVSAGGVQDVALGALVGLVLGILVTALLEAVSPTIIGADTIAVELGAPIPRSAAVHALTAGAMATMILAVMSRATLGHTGRELRANAATQAAYILVTVGAVLRVAAPLGLSDFRMGMEVAGAAWMGAFLLFLAAYGPILLGPRIDGKL